jgi:hypothetical protein
LPVSRFDPVLVETSAGFVVPRLRQSSFGLRAPMCKAAGRCLLLGLAPFGPLARGAEVDEVAHAKLGGNQICGLVWNNYADTVTLDHGNRQRKRSRFKLPYGSVAIPAASGKTRLLEQKKYRRRLSRSLEEYKRRRTTEFAQYLDNSRATSEKTPVYLRCFGKERWVMPPILRIHFSDRYKHTVAKGHESVIAALPPVSIATYAVDGRTPG